MLTALIFVAAMLYASVGHAGASGYLAAMALVGIAPDVMKPTALVLNILVATIATIEFYRAGHFSWSKFKIFAVTSIPCAFVGGTLSLPAHLYKPVVGATLLVAAIRMVGIGGSPARSIDRPFQPLSWQNAMIAGALIGLLSGLTGVGGGIFLSPLLLLMGWADSKQTASISAAFILVNSIAGLLGHGFNISTLHPETAIWGIAAIAGGSIGAKYGSQQFDDRTIKLLLAVVLIIAGVKMIWTRA
jgi:uncharacterized protein